MTDAYVPLSYWDLLFSAVLILINGALSLGFRLGLERSLFLAALRMTVQLMAIGFVLKFIFSQTSALWTVGLALIMILVAGREVFARQTTPFKGLWSYGLGTMTLLFVGTVATLFGVGVLIGPEPWYAPRFILPVLGMVLGNTLTGIGLGLETLTTTARRERAAIEARIALGAPRAEALSDVLRQALKTGLMPIINSMSASGLVSLPGMMTGQILSGVDPVEATKYQLLIMFLIGGATALGVLVAVLGGAWRLTDERHRLRLDRLRIEEDGNG
ncbi:MAG: ABC transporter permease [Methyloligellaceae bacterium]